MRRLLLQSAAFVRAARRLVKKKPETAPILQAALESLAEDGISHRENLSPTGHDVADQMMYISIESA